MRIMNFGSLAKSFAAAKPRILFLLAAFVLFTAGAGTVIGGEASVVQKCNALFDNRSFDCECAGKYIEMEYAPTDSELLLKLWAVSRNETRAQAISSEQLDRQYGSPKILKVLLKFNTLRLTLFANCPAVFSEGHDN